MYLCKMFLRQQKQNTVYLYPPCIICIKMCCLSKENLNFYCLYNVFCIFVAVRGCRPGKTVQMSESEVRGLCTKSREIFLQQPILLELEAPLKICGNFYLNNIFVSISQSSSKNLLPF